MMEAWRHLRTVRDSLRRYPSSWPICWLCRRLAMAGTGHRIGDGLGVMTVFAADKRRLIRIART